MTTDIKRKIAYNAWAEGLIDKGQLDLMNKHCDEIDRLQLVTDKMADDYYGLMIKNSATIKLKDYEND